MSRDLPSVPHQKCPLSKECSFLTGTVEYVAPVPEPAPPHTHPSLLRDDRAPRATEQQESVHTRSRRDCHSLAEVILKVARAQSLRDLAHGVSCARPTPAVPPFHAPQETVWSCRKHAAFQALSGATCLAIFVSVTPRKSGKVLLRVSSAFSRFTQARLHTAGRNDTESIAAA